MIAPINLPAGNADTHRSCMAFAIDMLEVYAQCETQKRETVKFYKGIE